MNRWLLGVTSVLGLLAVSALAQPHSDRQGGTMPRSLPPALAAGHAPWGVKFGEEFWRRPREPRDSTTKLDSSVAVPSGLNVGDVIERVSHAWTQRSNGLAAEVLGETYRALTTGAEVRFWPIRQPSLSDPEAVLRTTAVVSGEKNLYVAGGSAPAWCVVGNTAQALLAPEAGLLQHDEARADGVAITWVLTRPVTGMGPLLVEAELSGVRYAGATASGLHYADSTGVARVRVGHVTVVDSAGHRWEASLTGSTNRLRVEVAANILAEATYPLAIDPLINAEFGFDEPIITAKPNHQLRPAIAGGGDQYLVVWLDMLAVNINAARVSSDGVLADPGGIVVGGFGDTYSRLGVAANGDSYLVAWTDLRNVFTNQTDIYAARVDRAGVVLDPEAIPISRRAERQEQPAVAAAGRDYFVIWTDGRSGSTNYHEIYGTRVSAAGVVDNPDGTLLGRSEIYSEAALAGNGKSYLAVWQAYPGSLITAARVSGAGAVVDPGGFPLSQTRGEVPAVAGSAVGYLAAWIGYNGVSYGVQFTRVSDEGVVQNAGGSAIVNGNWHQYGPAVAASGTNYLVVWSDDRRSANDVYGARVTAAGTILDADGIFIRTAAEAPAVAGSTAGYLVAWEEAPTANAAFNIYATRVSAAGIVDGRIDVSFKPRARDPAIGFNGTEFLVAWTDLRNAATTGEDIYGTRVSVSGLILDPEGIPIGTGPGDDRTPAVAGQGGEFLTVWRSAAGVRSTRISSAGVATDSEGVLIGPGASPSWPVGVAGNGTNYLVVWSKGGLGSEDIYGARLSLTGDVLAPGEFAISTAGNGQLAPVVAANSGDYLVIWEDRRNFGNMDIYGSLIRGSGVVVHPSGLVIRANNYVKSGPSIAANASGYLVAWGEGDFTSDADINGARVSPAGVVIDPNGLPICTASGVQASPSVAANADSFLVVWEDQRNGPNQPDIYGARIYPGGFISPSEVTDQPAGHFYRTSPKAAAGGNGYVVMWMDSDTVAGSRLDDFGLSGNHRPLVPADPSSATLISHSANHQTAPALAAADGEYLVVWEDGRNLLTSGIDIYGARVTSAGQLLDPTGLAISTADQAQTSPAVAATSAGYLVAWGDQREAVAGIYAAHVSRTGIVTETNGIRIGNFPSFQYRRPAVASDGAAYLIAWRPDTSGNLKGLRVDRNAAITPADSFLITSSAVADFALAAMPEGGYLAAWTDLRNWSTSGYDIYGARIDSDGTLLDTGGIPICTASNWQVSPAIASGRDVALIVWNDARNASPDSTAEGIYGTRFTGAGILDADGIAITTHGSPQAPAVAANGSTFTVIWQEPHQVSFDQAADIWGARLAASGELLDRDPFVISADRRASAIASARPGQWLIVYEGIRAAVPRILGKFINEGPVLQPPAWLNGVPILSWSAEPGSTYRVQYKTGLADGLWTDLPGDITAVGPTASKPDESSGGSAQRFYRVILPR